MLSVINGLKRPQNLRRLVAPLAGSANHTRMFAGINQNMGNYPNHSNKVNPPANVCSSPVKNTDLDAMFNNPHLQKRKVPIQLRQSGDGKGASGEGGNEGAGSRILIDTRVRKGPYYHLSQEAGCWCYSTYNQIYHPRCYIPAEEGGSMTEYMYLTEHVTMWNVAVERQICVKGPDADAFVDYVTTRKVSDICPVGKCKYVIMCNNKGGVVNDPILLHPAENEWWYSIADSDVLFFLQGINHDNRWNVEIDEIDVSPVQIQGPKAEALMADAFGPHVPKMKYYDCIHEKIGDCEVVISCSGFTGELGFEIYLKDATKNAEVLWEHMLEKGKAHNMKVIAPGHARRIEGGFMSYHQDLDWEVNPYECGLGWQVGLKREDDFVGKEALKKINADGVTHKLAGLLMGGKPIEWYNADFYHVFNEKEELVGYVTSAWYSVTQGQNVAMAMLPVGYTDVGTKLRVALPHRYSTGDTDEAVVEKTPFKKPANPGTGLLTTGAKL